MKIAFLCPFKPSVVKDLLYKGTIIPDIHKSSEALSLIIRELAIRGHEIVVYTYCREKMPYVKLDGRNITIHIISSFSSIKGAAVFSRLYMVNRLRKLISKDIDSLQIIHAHWTYDYALAASHFSSKVPVVCTVRDWCPKIIKMQDNIPMLLYWIVSWCIFRIVMRKKITFIANSEYIKHKVDDYLGKTDTKAIFNCVDINKYKYSSTKPDCDEPIFVSISQSADYKLKNIDTLMYAFNKLHNRYPQCRLRLLGRGFEIGTPFYDTWLSRKMLDGVELCGYVDHNQLIEILKSSTCLVHPSLEESFGNTLLEGMACKIPVIGGMESGAVPYVLGHGSYGLLCDVNSSDDIATVMEKTIMNKESVKNVVEKAYSYLCENFNVHTIVNEHIELYKKCLS